MMRLFKKTILGCTRPSSSSLSHAFDADASDYIEVTSCSKFFYCRLLIVLAGFMATPSHATDWELFEAAMSALSSYRGGSIHNDYHRLLAGQTEGLDLSLDEVEYCADLARESNLISEIVRRSKPHGYKQLWSGRVIPFGVPSLPTTPGTIFTNPGHLSTSYEKDVAAEFAGAPLGEPRIGRANGQRIMIQVENADMMPGATMWNLGDGYDEGFEWQKEIVTAANPKFRVLDSKQAMMNGRKVEQISVEYLPDISKDRPKWICPKGDCISQTMKKSIVQTAKMAPKVPVSAPRLPGAKFIGPAGFVLSAGSAYADFVYRQADYKYNNVKTLISPSADAVIESVLNQVALGGIPDPRNTHVNTKYKPGRSFSHNACGRWAPQSFSEVYEGTIGPTVDWWMNGW